MSLVHTIRTDKQVLIKNTTVHLQLYQKSPCELKKHLKIL